MQTNLVRQTIVPALHLTDLMRRLAARIAAREARQRQARDLARLDDRLLADIGLNRGTAAQEARRLMRF